MQGTPSLGHGQVGHMLHNVFRPHHLLANVATREGCNCCIFIYTVPLTCKEFSYPLIDLTGGKVLNSSINWSYEKRFCLANAVVTDVGLSGCKNLEFPVQHHQTWHLALQHFINSPVLLHVGIPNITQSNLAEVVEMAGRQLQVTPSSSETKCYQTLWATVCKELAGSSSTYKAFRNMDMFLRLQSLSPRRTSSRVPGDGVVGFQKSDVAPWSSRWPCSSLPWIPGATRATDVRVASPLGMLSQATW